MREPADRYSSVAILLHWLIAGLLIGNIVIALTMDSAVLFQTHKSIGILVLLLTGVRLVWRLTHPWPALATSLGAWERMAARTTHFAFYVLLLAVPLLGWAAASTGRRGTGDLFGVIPWFDLPLGKSGELHDLTGEAHELAVYLTIALIVLHVAGALKHQLIDRDGTLRRMLPGR